MINRVTFSSHPASWHAWNQRATQVVTANMRAAASTYLDAYDYGNPYVRFLAQHLGFGFDLRRRTVTVPQISDVVQRIDHFFAARGVQRGTGLHPARLVVLPSGKKIPIFFGEEPPARATLPTRLLSGGEWLRFLARGIQIIDEPDPLQLNHTYLEHSLVHMVGAMRFLPFAMTLQFRAQEKVRRMGAHAELDERFNSRLYCATEILSHVPRTAQATLLETAGLPNDLEPGRARFEDVFGMYRRFSGARFAEIAENVQTWLMLNSDTVGAVYGTPLQPTHWADLRHRQFTSRRNLFARAVTLLLRLSEIPPERFVSEALQEPLDPSSKVCDLFTRSGIFEANLAIGRRFLQTKKSAPGMARTCDNRLRRPVLYPADYGRVLV